MLMTNAPVGVTVGSRAELRVTVVVVNTVVAGHTLRVDVIVETRM